MAHVRQHDVERVLVDERLHQLDAALIGCHLRLEIGKVVVQTARRRDARRRRRREQARDERVVKDAVAYDTGRREAAAFVDQRSTVRRHRTRRDAAHVGVMTDERRRCQKQPNKQTTRQVFCTRATRRKTPLVRHGRRA